MAKRESWADPTGRKPLPEIREDYEYAKTGWKSDRDAADDDMKNVGGNPWTEDDLDVREGRPTIAPDEMTQYRNQVTNDVRKTPRGMKFQPVGFGASQRTAEFYQSKAREIEYRSDAAEHYVEGLENVLQRGFGGWRVGIRYDKPRDVNPEIFIEGFPDPSVILPDPDIRREHGQDMKFCFVLEQMRISDFKRRFKGAEIRSFGDYQARPKFNDWLIGTKTIQVAEHWKIEYKPRELFAVVLVPVNPSGAVPLPSTLKPMAMFEEEIEAAVASRRVKVASSRRVRTVDYPNVVMRVTNGLEVLETKNDWPGRYIPIVLLFGPTLWVKDGGEVKRKTLSMTRLMKEPWKAFCFASSQELEVLGQVPKAAAVAYVGQLAGQEEEWNESLQRPKAVLYALARTPSMTETEERLPLPQRMEYAQAEYLQSIEVVKEGYRRSIQAAAGSNFLPTNAQKLNDKSGVALDKMDESYTAGTYHYVHTYESGVEWSGTIIEDLMGHVYDYTGETGIMNRKNEASTVRINDDADEGAFSTKGDHLVTVQTMPMSDSDFDAVDKFIALMVNSLGEIAQICGPAAAAYVFSMSIKMRNLGPQGDELADAMLPPQYRAKDGKPPDPRLMQLTQQVQTLQQQLQKAQFEIQTGAAKEKIKGAIQREIAELKAMATSADKDKDRAAKLEVAAISAKIETMGMVLQELERIGGLSEAERERMLTADEGANQRTHEAVEGHKTRTHEAIQAAAGRAHEKVMEPLKAALAPSMPPSGE